MCYLMRECSAELLSLLQEAAMNTENSSAACDVIYEPFTPFSATLSRDFIILTTTRFRPAAAKVCESLCRNYLRWKNCVRTTLSRYHDILEKISLTTLFFLCFCFVIIFVRFSRPCVTVLYVWDWFILFVASFGVNNIKICFFLVTG